MTEVWRWNVDAAWHHFSWMCQEAYIAGKASNVFEKYHHLSACLYFGIGALEAFLNARMRERFKGIKTEDEILKILKHARLKDKLTKWPSVLCGEPVHVPTQLVEAINDFNLLRGESTHQKKRDHSLFRDLDATRPEELVSVVTQYQVVVYERLRLVFPYWLLGWNYIGINNDPEAPCLINNQQFRYSLRYLGEDVPAAEYEKALAWEHEHMTSMAGFLRLKTVLDSKEIDIEPFDLRLPGRPRLCRYWWNSTLRRGN